MGLFGSSGIRGRVGDVITTDLALDIGRALGGTHDRVVIGRDPRTTGEMLARALASGLMSCGAQVSDAGMVSTPTLAHAARSFDCGVMVTASHNPPEYNGFKFWNPDGLAFVDSQREALEGALQSGAFTSASWRDVGGITEYPDAVEEHIESILAEIPTVELRVVVDAGCGATGGITPILFEKMGCEVVALNAEADGRFPGRDPEPSEENLSLLRKTVKETGADLGIAHDGDGDRMVAMDATGRYLGGDVLLPLFVSRCGRGKVVVPVNASMAVDDIAGRENVVRTRVGDVFVGEAVKAEGASFGGEPSGTWIFPDHSLCPDGVYAAARLASLAAEEDLTALVDALPHYQILQEAYEYTGPRDSVEAGLDEALTAKGWDVSTMDGWRVTWEDAWGLVRLSGTEPKVRVTAEARDAVRAREALKTLEAIVLGVVG
jgi:phosphoglucosamine mutase